MPADYDTQLRRSFSPHPEKEKRTLGYDRQLVHSPILAVPADAGWGRQRDSAKVEGGIFQI